MKLPSFVLFWIKNGYQVTWNLTHILSNLKTFRKPKNFLNKTWHFLPTSSYVSIFRKKLSFYLFLLDCKLYFYAFWIFTNFNVSMSFLWEYFCLNIHYGNTLLHFSLEGAKYHKIKKKKFFLHTSHKSAIKNNPRMQLRSISHETVTRNKLKAWKLFQGNRLSSFSPNKKTVTRVEGEGGKFVLFWSLFSPVCVNLQNKLNYHKSIITINSFPFNALLIFSHLQVYCFFPLFFFNFFIHLMHKNK